MVVEPLTDTVEICWYSDMQLRRQGWSLIVVRPRDLVHYWIVQECRICQVLHIDRDVPKVTLANDAIGDKARWLDPSQARHNFAANLGGFLR